MAAAPKVFQFKLVLLGDSAVGKSSLVLRFVRGQFFEYQESTIGGTRDLRRLLLPGAGPWASDRAAQKRQPCAACPRCCIGAAAEQPMRWADGEGRKADSGAAQRMPPLCCARRG
jgi:hypothetical protein